MTKIAIIGPGAVGGTIAHDLLPTFTHLTLVGRQSQTITYTESTAPNTETIINVTAIDEFKDPVDILFIAVKIPQLDAVIQKLPNFIHEDTIIILAQNGTGQLSRIPHKHVFQAVVYISGQKRQQHITHFRDHQLILQNSPSTQQLQHLFSTTQLDITLVEDIDQSIWYKLLVNLAINTVTALSRQTAQVLKVEGIQTLCERLLQEGVKIAQAEGVIFHQDVISEIMTIYQGYPDHMGTSMYYDIIEGKPLEIAGIQGFLYQVARKHQLATPTLDTVYPLLLAQQQ